MLGLILAAAVYSCPVEIGVSVGPFFAVNVYYEHEGEDGRAYTYRTVQLLDPGTYDVVPEGHPAGISWSDGTFCGVLPSLVFRDGFESGSIGRWDHSQTGGI